MKKLKNMKMKNMKKLKKKILGGGGWQKVRHFMPKKCISTFFFDFVLRGRLRLGMG